MYIYIYMCVYIYIHLHMKPHPQRGPPYVRSSAATAKQIILQYLYLYIYIGRLGS